MNLDRLERYIETFYGEPERLERDQWNYEDGCVLLAAIQLYRATGKASFREYVLNYLDRYVTESGAIRTYRPEEYDLDDVMPGRALIFAWEETGEERYRKAVEALLDQLKEQPRTASGNYWQRKANSDQIWLDGLFMAMPFRMEWDTRYGKKDQYLDILRQFEWVRDHMRDEKTGLYCHSLDESRKGLGADPVSGRSAVFQLKGMGWYLLGLADTIEEMDRRVYDFMRPLQDILKEGLQGLMAYRDGETGLLWQTVDQAEMPGNQIEAFGSAMAAAAIFKACRLRLILGEKYAPMAERILESLTEEMLEERDGKIVLKEDCQAAALFMAYAQYLLYQSWESGERIHLKE